MQFEYKGIEFKISYVFIALVGLFIITDKTGLSVMVVLAAVIHEFGHLTAMFFLNSVPSSISMQIFGIRIEKKTNLSLSYIDECVIYFAGPLINFICALIFWAVYNLSLNPFFINVCVLHTVTALFNLMPVGVLDGGNIVRSILRKYMSVDNACIVQNIISVIFLVPIAATAFMLVLSDHHNYTLVVTTIYLTVMLIMQSGN